MASFRLQTLRTRGRESDIVVDYTYIHSHIVLQCIISNIYIYNIYNIYIYIIFIYWSIFNSNGGGFDPRCKQQWSMRDSQNPLRRDNSSK